MSVILLLIGLAQLSIQFVMLLLVLDEAPSGSLPVDQLRDTERRTIDRLYRAAADSWTDDE